MSKKAIKKTWTAFAFRCLKTLFVMYLPQFPSDSHPVSKIFAESLSGVQSCFYIFLKDLINEVKSSRQKRPQLVNALNVLRFEMRGLI